MIKNVTYMVMQLYKLRINTHTHTYAPNNIHMPNIILKQPKCPVLGKGFSKS